MKANVYLILHYVLTALRLQWELMPRSNFLVSEIWWMGLQESNLGVEIVEIIPKRRLENNVLRNDYQSF